MPKLLIMNGPNLNLLGQREPEIYGPGTLADLETHLRSVAAAAGFEAECFQSNAESALVERIHAAGTQGVAGIVFNPGAYTHTSIALRDALLGVAVPFIEVHISNVFARESFRHTSYLSDVALGVISGLGTYGYELAVLAMRERLARKAARP